MSAAEPGTSPVWRRVGPHAVLVEVGDPASALALASWAREHAVPAVEIVPGAASVLFDGVDPEVVVQELAGWPRTGTPPAGERVEVPVVYDGEDLAFVADAWGMGVEETVERHSSLELVSAFCGFAPGFAYLAGLPDELAVPRLDTPRPRVPAGAVAVAGPWCGVYPTASPGGWRIIGRTDLTLWDPDREPPALLAPGTRVSFVPA